MRQGTARRSNGLGSRREVGEAGGWSRADSGNREMRLEERDFVASSHTVSPICSGASGTANQILRLESGPPFGFPAVLARVGGRGRGVRSQDAPHEALDCDRRSFRRRDVPGATICAAPAGAPRRSSTPLRPPLLDREPYFSAWANVEAALGNVPSGSRQRLFAVADGLDAERAEYDASVYAKFGPASPYLHVTFTCTSLRCPVRSCLAG